MRQEGQRLWEPQEIQAWRLARRDAALRPYEVVVASDRWQEGRRDEPEATRHRRVLGRGVGGGHPGQVD